MGILDSMNQWEELDIPPPSLQSLLWQFVEGIHPYPNCMECDITYLIPRWILDERPPLSITIRKYPKRYIIATSRDNQPTQINREGYHHFFEQDWNEIIIGLRHHVLRATKIGLVDQQKE